MTVRRDDPRPAYMQVAAFIEQAIASGDYPPGGRLPSGRDLAKRLGVALNTVQHAIRHLKDQSVLVSVPPRGVFVASADLATKHSADDAEIIRQLGVMQEAMETLTRRVAALEQLLGGTDPEPG
jgi:DNA-binding transcriptional regulator YhcF (GntR family)